MNAHQRTASVWDLVKSVPPHFLFGAMLFAALWLMAQHFVTSKEYEKDQTALQSTLSEMRQDIKEILKKGIK